MLVKYVARMTAAAMGMTATFLPKPLYGEAGSGMHFHQQLWQGERNVCYDAAGYGSSSATARSLHRGAAGARRGGHGVHKPVHQLVPAPGARLRGAGERRLLARQPQRRRPHPDLREPAGQRAVRVPARPTRRPTRTSRWPRSCWPGSTACAGAPTRRRSASGPWTATWRPFRTSGALAHQGAPHVARRGARCPGARSRLPAAGDVFGAELIGRWIRKKREEEREVATRPHPYEVELYYGM